MKIGTYNQLQIVCILSLAASFGLTGCKAGGWKMPKMSWNREPSATTLAGSETPKLPESPANKYTPSTIASVGAGTSPGTPSGNKAPTNGYAGQTTSATTPATAGLAASANGYQTGPYTVGQRASAGSTQPNTSSTSGNVAPGPNPYGGSYAGMNPTKPSDTTLGGAKNSFATYPTPSASTGYGSAPQGYAATPTGTPTASNLGTVPGSNPAYTGVNGGLPQLPPANTYGLNTSNTNVPTNAPSPSTSYPSLPPIPGTGTLATGTTPVNQTTQLPTYPGTLPGQPTVGQTSVGNYTAGNTLTGTPASNRYSGVYQPGTTSRPTTYNFGSVTPAQATAPSNTGTSLPPNTASNPPNTLMR
jgi:hypothetical protein